MADTGREEQAHESVVSIIGTVRSVGPKQVVCYPIVMGAPSFDHARNKSVQGHSLSWYSGEWYEVFAEDLDAFAEARVVNPTTEEWLSYMRTCSEAHVKATFGRLLAEPLRADWGGELDDLFASAAHIRERRTTVAFLLKGPGGGFREMTPDLLGKRADQVVRLASTPAQLLVVQHCHTIGEAVRQTLRAFCVAPHHPRRYCLIDGKDTYRILKAYHSLQP